MCGYLKDPGTYRYKNALPKCIVKLLEPIFIDLRSESLLQKCLHGKTQKNECLNKLIWDRCYEEYFVERKTVEEAVYSAIAVAHFNDGATSTMKLLKLGVSPGHYTEQLRISKDAQRIKKSACKAAEAAKKHGKDKRAVRKVSWIACPKLTRICMIQWPVKVPGMLGECKFFLPFSQNAIFLLFINFSNTLL